MSDDQAYKCFMAKMGALAARWKDTALMRNELAEIVFGLLERLSPVERAAVLADAARLLAFKATQKGA